MQELVKKAQKGDCAAFAVLYEQVYEDLYRTAYYFLGNGEDARDAVSDTVLAAFEQMHRLRRAEAFRAWIFKILLNLCKRKRREYAESTIELSETLRAAEETYSREQQMDARKAFFSLDEIDRQILACTLFAGYTSAETAKLLRMNANTVRSRQSRALKILRGWLQ